MKQPEIRFLVTDVDGTLTDGKIYMGPGGELMKAFSVKDGYAINFILKPAGILPIVITARSSVIVQNRCAELGITEVHQGKMDKLAALQEIVGKDELGSCAYFGDDILDLKCMLPIKAAGGIIGCPSDAVREVKAASDHICVHKAGNGAFREFAEWLVKPQENAEAADEQSDALIGYLKGLDASKLSDASKKVIMDSLFDLVQSCMTQSEKRPHPH